MLHEEIRHVQNAKLSAASAPAQLPLLSGQRAGVSQQKRRLTLS